MTFTSLTSFHGVIILITSIIVGVVTSASLSPDGRWMEWHASRLGEGGEVSSLVFNLTFVVSAALMILIGLRLHTELRHTPRTARFVRACIVTTASCLMGLAIFPFDQFPVIHNIFGYGQYLFLGSVVVVASRTYPSLRAVTYRVGLAAITITLALIIIYHATHLLSLLAVEIVGQSLLFAWLLLFTREVSSAFSDDN